LAFNFLTSGVSRQRRDSVVNNVLNRAGFELSQELATERPITVVSDTQPHLGQMSFCIDNRMNPCIYASATVPQTAATVRIVFLRQLFVDR
jgi:hypothetical protein